jgi:hypothetical protein
MLRVDLLARHSDRESIVTSFIGQASSVWKGGEGKWRQIKDYEKGKIIMTN